jgi:catechol 2,3-dioxygenase
MSFAVVTGSSSPKTDNPPSTGFPILHHIGIMTLDIKKMTDWYSKVLGMKSNFENSSRSASDANPVQVNLLTNDGADHRIALISWPGLSENKEKYKFTRLQHVAFEHKSIRDLLNSYSHLKYQEIVPIIVVNHGPTISFYYHDPEANVVELFAYNFGNWDSSWDEFVRTMGTKFVFMPIDPDKIIAAQKKGLSDLQIHQYVNSGEFSPSEPIDMKRLLSM